MTEHTPLYDGMTGDAASGLGPSWNPGDGRQVRTQLDGTGVRDQRMSSTASGMVMK
jgi:hypothetical protein